MLIAVLILATVAFAAQALRAGRLLYSALWLAGASALLATVVFQLGAPEVAVIELSVGAGLVTVLFVFAINVAGEENIAGRPIVPIWAGGTAVLAVMVLLGSLSLPLPTPVGAGGEGTFAAALWQARGLDVLIQMVLIFAGVLGLLGLLAEAAAPLDQSVARAVAAGRQRDLQELERTAGEVKPREEVRV
jgi:uncharacterized MnhB-related membrane protein